MAIAGVVEGTEGDKLRFRYQDKSRTLPLKQVEGLVLAVAAGARAAGRAPADLLAGRAARRLGPPGRTSTPPTWKVETPWGQSLKLPAAEVQRRPVPGRPDDLPVRPRAEQGRGDPLLRPPPPLATRRQPRSASPSRSTARPSSTGWPSTRGRVLTYDLDGRYATFEALVGFDEAAKGKGRVDCRVFADGKELYANPDLRADAPPVTLSLPVAGAEQLQLVVDFGPARTRATA